MFDDKTLEKIFSDEKSQSVPIVYQATMIHVIERVLEEKETTDATLRKPNVLSATAISDLSATDADNSLTVDTESYNGYQW